MCRKVLAAAAGWAADNLHAFAAQAERLQNRLARHDLPHRIAGKRNADRVSDPFQQQCPDTHGGFDERKLSSARLRHADMQRIAARLLQQAVGFHRFRDA